MPEQKPKYRYLLTRGGVTTKFRSTGPYGAARKAAAAIFRASKSVTKTRFTIRRHSRGEVNDYTYTATCKRYPGEGKRVRDKRTNETLFKKKMDVFVTRVG